MFITQVRVDKLLRTEQLARQGQVELGAIMNVAPESISAMETVASRVVQGLAGDQFAIETEARRRVQAAEADRANVIAESNSQMVNTTAATVEGALGGATTGLGVASSIQGLFQAGKQASQSEQIGKQQIAIQEQSAISTGVQAQIERLQLEWITSELASARQLSSALGTSVGNLRMQGFLEGAKIRKSL